MSTIRRFIHRYRKWFIPLLVIAAVDAVLNVGVIVSEQMAHHEDVEWAFYIINEVTGSFTLLLFLPFLIAVFKKRPLRKPFLWSRLALYLAVSVVFGFLYTSLMYLARVPLYHLFGITRLDAIFNDLPYRYLMEYFKQFFTFWLVYVVYWAISQYRANRNRERQAAALKEELLRAQVQSLQMQLHPHFFFNTLNTVSSLMYKDPARADKLISRLSDFIRNVMGLKDQPLHSLEMEIHLLRQFTDVMRERYPDKLSVVYHLPEDCRRAPVPVLLLQPIVENAIQYSIGFREKTRVEVRVTGANGQVDIQISDNGPGIDAEGISPGTGLSATVLRLEKLYGDRYRFELRNGKAEGSTVWISLPKEMR